MSLRAVIFDLFGTLVSYPPGARHVHAMAEKLEITYEALHHEWSALRAARDSGELDTLASLRVCCERLGLTRSDDQLRFACTEVLEFFREILTPREGALPALAALRTRGLRLGLVSDANLETSNLWQGTTLAPLIDCAVFSSVERVRKPDRSLYRVVCERLGVAARDCLYVGNGDGDELAGAIAAGMRAVLFTAPGEHPGREAAEWRETQIADLAEVLPMVAEPRPPERTIPAA